MSLLLDFDLVNALQVIKVVLAQQEATKVLNALISPTPPEKLHQDVLNAQQRLAAAMISELLNLWTVLIIINHFS